MISSRIKAILNKYLVALSQKDKQRAAYAVELLLLMDLEITFSENDANMYEARQAAIERAAVMWKDLKTMIGAKDKTIHDFLRALYYRCLFPTLVKLEMPEHLRESVKELTKHLFLVMQDAYVPIRAPTKKQRCCLVQPHPTHARHFELTDFANKFETHLKMFGIRVIRESGETKTEENWSNDKDVFVIVLCSELLRITHQLYSHSKQHPWKQMFVKLVERQAKMPHFICSLLISGTVVTSIPKKLQNVQRLDVRVMGYERTMDSVTSWFA